MIHPGFLVHRIENESATQNWDAVLPLLDRLERLPGQSDPDLREYLLYQRGCALLELQRPTEARAPLRELVRRVPREAQFRLVLADCLIRDEAWDDALTELEAGLSVEPDHPGCLCALGWTLYQTGEQNQGRALLEQALEAHPEYYPAHLDLGLILAAEGRWDDSEAHLCAARSICPEDPEIDEILDAVRENRSREANERRHLRALSARLRRARRELPPGEASLLRVLRKHLLARGAAHLEVLLAENLWVHFAGTEEPRPSLDPTWAAAVAHASHRLHDRDVPRDEVAREWKVSEAALHQRFRRLLRILEDPALGYAAAALEAGLRDEGETAPSLNVIRVDFTRTHGEN